MNKVGEPAPSGGGGQPSPEQAPANGAPQPSITLTADQLDSIVEKASAKASDGARNAVFAELRKSGVLGKEKDPAPPPAGDPKSPPPALTADAVERMLERERVFTRVATQHGLDDAQLTRMQKALRSDNPDDVGAWTTSYLADMKLVKAPDPNNPGGSAKDPSKPAGTTISAPPVSDKGPPSGAPRDFASISNPNDLTDGDIERLVNQHGEEKAEQMIADLASRWLNTVRIKIGPEHER
jgi:hypothetical protein